MEFVLVASNQTHLTHQTNPSYLYRIGGGKAVSQRHSVASLDPMGALRRLSVKRLRTRSMGDWG